VTASKSWVWRRLKREDERDWARGRERRVEEVVSHGHFCKVRSLKMKEERESKRIFIQKNKKKKERKREKSGFSFTKFYSPK
jgi:hypothetical protein